MSQFREPESSALDFPKDRTDSERERKEEADRNRSELKTPGRRRTRGRRRRCQWTSSSDATRDAKSFVGTLATLWLNIGGGNGNGNAFAASTVFVDWFATTDVADIVSATYRISLTRIVTCDDPDPVMELEAVSELRAIATADGPAIASSGASCQIAGDLELENGIAVISGTTPTETTVSIGVITIVPFVESEGRVAPPPAIVPRRARLEQPDGVMLAATSLAVKARATGDTGEAESEIRSELTGFISVQCRHCGGTGRVDF